MSEDIRINLRRQNSRIREINIIGNGERGIAPIVFELPYCFMPMSFINDTDEILPDEDAGTEQERADKERLLDLDSRKNHLHEECYYHPEHNKRGELEDVLKELITLAARHGIYHIPIRLISIDPDAKVESKYGRYDVEFAPEWIIADFGGEPSIESAASMFVHSLLDFCEGLLTQAVVYTDGDPAPYTEIAEEAAEIFKRYSAFVEQKYAEKKDDEEYQHRNDLGFA